jgi:hypothetical protein
MTCGEHLANALEFALKKLSEYKTPDPIRVAEETAQQFDLGPRDEEWLLNELKRASKKKPADGGSSVS